MANRNTSSGTSILLVILLLLTFPLWFGLGMGAFGIIFGVFGAIAGVIAAAFGGMIWIVTIPFRVLFDFGDWGWGPSCFSHKGFAIVALIVIAALWVKKQKKTA